MKIIKNPEDNFIYIKKTKEEAEELFNNNIELFIYNPEDNSERLVFSEDDFNSIGDGEYYVEEGDQFFNYLEDEIMTNNSIQNIIKLHSGREILINDAEMYFEWKLNGKMRDTMLYSVSDNGIENFISLFIKEEQLKIEKSDKFKIYKISLKSNNFFSIVNILLENGYSKEDILDYFGIEKEKFSWYDRFIK